MKVSQVKEYSVNNGLPWTAEDYQYAIDNGAEKDEDFAPPKKAKAPDINTGFVMGPTGMQFNPLAANVAAGAARGATAGFADAPMVGPTGSEGLDLAGELAGQFGELSGMAATTAMLPPGPAALGRLPGMLSRMAPSGFKGLEYGLASGTAEGINQGEDLPGVLESAATGAGRDALMFGGLAGIPKFPAKLGGTYGQSFAIGTGLGAATGGLKGALTGGPAFLLSHAVTGPAFESRPSGRPEVRAEKEAKALEAKKLEEMLADYQAEQAANEAFNELKSQKFEDLTPTRQEAAQEKKWRREQAAYSAGQKSILNPGSKPAMAGEAALELTDAPPDARTKPNEGPKVPLWSGRGELTSESPAERADYERRRPLIEMGLEDALRRSQFPEMYAPADATQNPAESNAARAAREDALAAAYDQTTAPMTPEQAAAVAPSLEIPGLRRPGSVIDPTARGEAGGPIEVVPGGTGEPVRAPRRPGAMPENQQAGRPPMAAEDLIDTTSRTVGAPEMDWWGRAEDQGPLGTHNVPPEAMRTPKPGFLRTAEDRIPPDSQDARSDTQAPGGDVTLGSGFGALQQAAGRLAIPVEPSAPLHDVALDRGLWAHREGGTLRDMVREFPRLGEVSRGVKADIARVAKEIGDVRSPAALFSDPVEALAGIAGGKSGTPLDQALLGPQSALEHGRIIQKERWRQPLDKAIETLKIKPGDKVDSAFGDIGEQISRGDVHVPAQAIATRPAIQEIAKARKLNPDELIRSIEFAKIGRTFSDQVRFDVNTARTASGRREIPYIDKYVTWMRRNSFMDSMRGIGRFAGEGGGSLSPSYLHPSEKINPRALSRGKELTYERETSGIKLLESYLDISSKDIFYNAGIKHYRALAQELSNAGMTNAAQKLNRIVDVQMGLRAPFTEQAKDLMGMNTGPAYAARKGAEWISRNWFQNIFKWNLKFPLKTQAFGLAAAPAMYGQRAAAEGMQLISNPEWRAAWTKQGQIGALKRVQEGRITQSEGLERGRQAKGKLDQIGYGLMNGMEDFTTMYGSSVAYAHGYRHGLRGRALWDYSDIGGKRIAGFYSSYLKPDIISGKSISLLAPMQSFNFQMASNLASAMGARTGSYKMQAGEGAKGVAMRTYMVGRWLAWMISANLLSEKLGLGASWQIPGSAIPFGDILTGGSSDSPKVTKGVSKLLHKPKIGGMEVIPVALGATGRGAEDSGKPWIGEATKDFYDGVAAMIRSDDEGNMEPNWKPLRQFALNYLWPKGGGVQIERIIEAAEAYAQEGQVKDAAGRTMYTIPEGPQTAASFVFGPSGTPAAREDKSAAKGGDSRPTRRAIPKR